MTGSVATGTRTTASTVPIAWEACSCVSTEGRVFGACSMSMVSHESIRTVESISVICGQHAEAQTPSKPRGSRVSSALLKVLVRSIIEGAAVTREANRERETDKGDVSGESDDEQHMRRAKQTHKVQQADRETKKTSIVRTDARPIVHLIK